MGMLYYDYKFKDKQMQDQWDDIVNNTIQYMQLYYRKQLSMTKLLYIGEFFILHQRY